MNFIRERIQHKCMYMYMYVYVYAYTYTYTYVYTYTYTYMYKSPAGSISLYFTRIIICIYTELAPKLMETASIAQSVER